MRSIQAVALILALGGVLLAADNQRGAIGDLVKIEGKNLTIAMAGRGAEERVIEVDDATTYTVNQQPGKLEDLKPGMRITATRLLGKLAVIASEKGTMGVVSKIDGTSLVLSVRGAESKVETGEKTRVVFIGTAGTPGKEGKVADIAAGARVEVFPATGVAERIVVLPIPRREAK